MSELALNLLSGHLGALVGAFATLRAAQWQLRQMSKTHAAALAHQNEILEQTFKHQRELLAAEQKLKTQLEALTRLHEVLNEVVRPAYLDGHQLLVNRSDGVVAKVFIRGEEVWSGDGFAAVFEKKKLGGVLLARDGAPPQALAAE